MGCIFPHKERFMHYGNSGTNRQFSMGSSNDIAVAGLAFVPYYPYAFYSAQTSERYSYVAY